MATTLEVILKGIDNVSGAFRSAGKSLDDLDSKAGKVRSSLKPLNDLLGVGFKAAAATAVGAVAAVGAGFASSVMKASDLEQGVADIGAAMGTSAEDTERLKKLILDLGFDPTLVVNAEGASEAIMALGTAGVSLDDIMGGAAKSTVLLANATGAQLGDAADIATSAMSIFGISAENMQAAVDDITGTTIASKFQIGDYALALGTGAKGADAANMSFEQFNRMLTAIAPNFTSGMTAGTGMTAMLLGMVPSTDKARGMMKELGMITAEGQNRFFDLNGELKSNEEISAVLRETLGSLTTEQRLAYVETIFGRDAMAAVNGMIATTDDSWQKYGKTLDETDSQEQARRRMDTFKGSLSILSDTFDALQTGIGSEFLPVLSDLMDTLAAFLKAQAPAIIAWSKDMAARLGDLIDKYMPVFLEKVQEWISKAPALIENIKEGATQLGSFIAKVIEVVGPLVDWITNSENLKGVLTAVAAVMALNAIVSVVSFVSAVWTAVTAVGAFMFALSPVVLVVGGIALAIVGLYTAWQTNFLGIRDITSAVWEKLKEWFGNIADWFRDFPDKLNSFGESLRTKANEVISKVGEGIQSAKAFVLTAWDGIKGGLETARDNWAGPFGQGLYDKAKAGLGKLSEGFNAVKESVKGELERVMSDVKERGFAYAAGAFAGRMIEGGREVLNKFLGGINEAAPGLISGFSQKLNELPTIFNNIIDGFKIHVFGVAASVWQNFKDGLSSTDIGASMVQGLDNVINAFNSTMDSFREHVWGVMTGIGGRIVDGLAQGIRDAFGSLRDALDWIVSVAPDWVKDKLGISSPSKVFMEIGSDIMGGLTQGIASMSDVPAMALESATMGVIEGGTMDYSRTSNFYLNAPQAASRGRPDAASTQMRQLIGELSAVYAGG